MNKSGKHEMYKGCCDATALEFLLVKLIAEVSYSKSFNPIVYQNRWSPSFTLLSYSV
jgi:hypothetical protein